MSAGAKPTNSAAQPWMWPTDRHAYDRTPSLAIDEVTALAALSCPGPMPWQNRVALTTLLQRLIAPIKDVLLSTQAGRSNGDAAVRLLCLEMHRRTSAFWDWTEYDWLEVLRLTPTTSNTYRSGRPYALAVAYLLCQFIQAWTLDHFHPTPFAEKVFGAATVQGEVQRLRAELVRWGYTGGRVAGELSTVLCRLFLISRSPWLADSTTEHLRMLSQQDDACQRRLVSMVSRGLVSLGLLEHIVGAEDRRPAGRDAVAELPGVHPEWLAWVQRWQATTTLQPESRRNVYRYTLQAGVWLTRAHPEITTPAQWTHPMVVEYVAAVNQLTVGEWVVHHDHLSNLPAGKIGQPLSPKGKYQHLAALRMFFRDCQEWDWIPRRFDPRRSFATPRSLRALIGPSPRVIADDIWAKLLNAGLNLTADDLPSITNSGGVPGTDQRARTLFYPLEMVGAILIVWLFTGLRANEIRRLRVGCVRWQREDVRVSGTTEILPKDAVCLLDVPVHKTGTAFTKPVDLVVGEAIEVWQGVRPLQPDLPDPKTGEVVQYLFAYRGRRISRTYLNAHLIPILCRKAGVPEQDARGTITSHRARSTIASQLYNAKEPMTLFELQEWLGHKSPASTQHYAKVTPTKLAKAYAEAGYFARNLRTIDVLIDQDAITSGAAATGEPWKYYDLGHGYCTYDFFDQCPHRMACAKCAFYRPKDSTAAHLVEGKTNLQHMLQAMPLTEEERTAVEDGIAALEQLAAQLADRPTPAGPTPRQLETWNQNAITLLAGNLLSEEHPNIRE